jgi:hypothetical protein
MVPFVVDVEQGLEVLVSLEVEDESRLKSLVSLVEEVESVVND